MLLSFKRLCQRRQPGGWLLFQYRSQRSNAGDVNANKTHIHELASKRTRAFVEQAKKEGRVHGKMWKNALDAVQDLKDGSSIMAGGFGLCGIPENLIMATAKHGAKNLEIISNELGTEKYGLSILLKSGQIKTVWSSFIGNNTPFQEKYFKGEIYLHLVPQGNLAERIRAGGAGIPAFYCHTGVDTWHEQGKIPIKYKAGYPHVIEQFNSKRESRFFGSQKYLLETSLTADFAFVKC